MFLDLSARRDEYDAIKSPFFFQMLATGPCGGYRTITIEIFCVSLVSRAKKNRDVQKSAICWL